jgi:hypothetical protein
MQEEIQGTNRKVEIQLLLIEGYVTVIAEVAYYDNVSLMIKNASRLIPQQNSKGQLVAGQIPFIFGCKKDEWVIFPMSKVIAQTVPEDGVLQDYKTLFGGGQVEIVKDLPAFMKRK